MLAANLDQVWRRHSLIIVTVLTATIVVAACAKSAQTRKVATASPPSVPAFVQSELAAGLYATGRNAPPFPLPVDQYKLNTVQSGVVLAARIELTGECASAHGYDYNAQDALAEAWLIMLSNLADFGMYHQLRRYGIASHGTAVKFGYHLPTDVSDSSNHGLSSSSSHGLGSVTGPEYSTVYGAQSYSCINIADRELNLSGPDPVNATIANSISRDSFNHARISRGAKEAISAWSQCMLEHGYRYRDPLAAGGAFDIDSPTPSPREISVATADSTCKRQHSVIAIWRQEEAREQREAIGSHAAVLEQARSEIMHVVRKACVILHLRQP